jgi:hypothetical protein
MEEFNNLIAIGVIGAVILVIGIILRLVVGPKGGKKKDGKAVNYKSEKGPAMAAGASSFKDGSLYDIKEEQDGVYKDTEKASKDDGKMESWKQYE